MTAPELDQLISTKAPTTQSPRSTILQRESPTKLPPHSSTVAAVKTTGEPLSAKEIEFLLRPDLTTPPQSPLTPTRTPIPVSEEAAGGSLNRCADSRAMGSGSRGDQTNQVTNKSEDQRCVITSFFLCFKLIIK